MNIIVSPHCLKRGPQFRFPHSKKKRIRNKWAKRDRNFRWLPQMYRMGETIIAHPVMARELKRQCLESSVDPMTLSALTTGLIRENVERITRDLFVRPEYTPSVEPNLTNSILWRTMLTFQPKATFTP